MGRRSKAESINEADAPRQKIEAQTEAGRPFGPDGLRGRGGPCDAMTCFTDATVQVLGHTEQRPGTGVNKTAGATPVAMARRVRFESLLRNRWSKGPEEHLELRRGPTRISIRQRAFESRTTAILRDKACRAFVSNSPVHQRPAASVEVPASSSSKGVTMSTCCSRASCRLSSPMKGHFFLQIA